MGYDHLSLEGKWPQIANIVSMSLLLLSAITFQISSTILSFNPTFSVLRSWYLTLQSQTETSWSWLLGSTPLGISTTMMWSNL